MFRVIAAILPASLHRIAYQAAHWARMAVWRITKPDIRGCSIVGHDMEGKVLLVRLSYGRDRWQLPGGGVGKREEPQVAARREMFEETGCEVVNLKLVAEFEEVILGANAQTYVFAGMVDQSPRVDGREIVEARFFPMHSLPEPLSGKTRKRLDMWSATKS